MFGSKNKASEEKQEVKKQAAAQGEKKPVSSGKPKNTHVSGQRPGHVAAEAPQAASTGAVKKTSSGNTQKAIKKSTAVKKKSTQAKTASDSASVKKKASPAKENAIKAKARELIKKLAKIDSLPKDVRSSIPFRGAMSGGIIETYPGTFTKSYRLKDVNFAIAKDEDQLAIYRAFMDFLNSFSEQTKWQFTIFNHEVDKRETIRQIRIPPQHDGLNKYRNELNNILLQNLKTGNRSVKQDKILTVSVDDLNVDHAIAVLNRTDGEIDNKLRKICGSDTHPMETKDRMKLLYSIYNQDADYRLATGVYDGEEELDLSVFEKAGLSIKDVIGPSGMNFSIANGSMFTLGEEYGQALYLDHVPANLSTSFMADLSDIKCNMLISVTSEAIASDKAVKMVKNQIGSIEARIAGVSKANSEEGYLAALPPDLAKSQASARDLLNDLTSRNQNLFFVTFLVVVFARTREDLEENIRLVQSVSGKHLCPMKPMRYQQEFAFNSALPLCRNDVFVERLYTTESAAVFIPYNSQEINQKNAIFYGLNQTTKSMILYDRLTGDNYNGLIFGSSGSGKSFTAKFEMISVLLNHADAQVFVVDPQGEYYPLVHALGGQEVRLAPGNNVYINPLDLDLSEDPDGETNPVIMKSDFIISMFDIIIGQNRELSAVHTTILDRCVRKIYRAYIEELQKTGLTCDLSKCPTLTDLYKELEMMSMEQYEAKELKDVLSQYAIGSFDTFAHRTNVNTNAKFVVYNTKVLGSGMKELGLHICTNDIWNRMIINSKKHIYTWFYIDEFHVLLESRPTTIFLRKIWKMARKWMGVPTGIMQNTEDLLKTADTRAIVANTNFMIMLKAAKQDRDNLAELLSLSPAQLEYITNPDPGHGLLYNGKITIPFGFKFPKNTKLYAVMTTQHDVEGAMFG